MSPTPDERFGYGERVSVRIVTHYPLADLSQAHLTVALQDTGHNTQRDLPMVLSETSRWQQLYTAEIDAAHQAFSSYQLSAMMKTPGQCCSDQIYFEIGVDRALVDAVMERTIAGDGDLNVSDTFQNTLDITSLQGTATGLALDYVDPATGQPFYQGYPPDLTNVIGAKTWLPPSAPYAAQVAQIKRALSHFVWQPVAPGPDIVGQGPARFTHLTDLPPVGTFYLTRWAQHVFHHAEAADTAQKAQDAAQLYDLIKNSTPVTNSPLGTATGFAFSVGDGAGVYINNQLDFPENMGGLIGRAYIPLGLPPATRDEPSGTVKLVVQPAAYRVLSCVGDQVRTNSTRFSEAQPLSIYAYAVQPGWTLTSADWNAAATKIGTVEVTTATVKPTLFGLPAGLVRGAASLAGQVARPSWVVIELRADEEAPPFSGSWWPDNVYGAPCYNHYDQTAYGSVVAIAPFPRFRRLTYPFAIVRPNSPDGSYGTMQADGALDFGNRTTLQEPEKQDLTITSAGTGPFSITEVEPPDLSTGFKIAASTCDHPVPPGQSCRITVAFAPPRTGFLSASLRLQTNLASGSLFIVLAGTGTTHLLPPMTTEPAETSLRAPEHCSSLLPPKVKLAGWEPYSDLDYPQTLDGQVVEGHKTTDDAFFNHYTLDYNFFVYPDPTYRGLLANPGNFTAGDGYEAGRMEIEWENGLGGKARGASAAGEPPWAWPTAGDRVHMVGAHIYDCGHKEEGFRSEIHPPRLLVTYRNAAQAPFAGYSGRLGSYYTPPDGPPTWATRVDVFASSYGGKAIYSAYGTLLLGYFSTHPLWWQPLNGQDYTFDIKAPPQPDPTAVLTYWECNHLIAGDCAHYGLRGTDSPVAGPTPTSSIPSSARRSAWGGSTAMRLPCPSTATV
jgi:hypothetical protein